MPAAAVIPAPIAYIKVVAVKKLVVGSWGTSRCPVCRDGVYCTLDLLSLLDGCRLLLTEWVWSAPDRLL